MPHRIPRDAGGDATLSTVFGRQVFVMEIRDFQQLIEKMYSHKDRQRGPAGTFVWLIEEVGELAAAIGEGTDQQKKEEFADVLAWLVTLANVEGIDLDQALHEKYGTGCPGCGKMVCTCGRKP
jgi:NTP pyrophosphatase (non-canonical NTP hydrolase)